MQKIVYLLLCMVMAGCSTAGSGIRNGSRGISKNHYKITGKVKNKVYYSPNNIFSIKLADLTGKGMVIRDSFKADFGQHTDPSYNIGAVSFTNNLASLFGIFYRVDAIEVPPKITQQHQSLEGLLDFYATYKLYSFKKSDPDAKIIHQEQVQLGNQQIKYFIIYTPQDNTYIININGQQYDILNAYFTFVHNNYVYVLSTQHLSERGSEQSNLDTDDIAILKTTLTRIFTAMSFNDKP